jgi:hypothetical protein
VVKCYSGVCGTSTGISNGVTYTACIFARIVYAGSAYSGTCSGPIVFGVVLDGGITCYMLGFGIFGVYVLTVIFVS